MSSKVVAIAVLLTLVLASFAPFAGAVDSSWGDKSSEAYILAITEDSGAFGLSWASFNTCLYFPSDQTLFLGPIVLFSPVSVPGISGLTARALYSGVGLFIGADSNIVLYSAYSSNASTFGYYSFAYPNPQDYVRFLDMSQGSLSADSTGATLVFSDSAMVSSIGSFSQSDVSWVPLSSFVDYASSGSEVPDLSAIENLLSQIGSKLDTANGYLSTIQTNTTSLRNMVDTLGTYWLSTFVNNPNLSTEGVFYKNFFEVYKGFNVWDTDGIEHPHSSLVDALYYSTYDLSAIGYYSRESQSSLAALQSVWADEEDIAFHESLDDTVSAVKDDYYGDDAVFTADTSKGSKQIVSGIGSAWSAGSDITPNQTINVMNNTTAWSQFFTPQMAATMDTVNTPVAISVDNVENPYAWIDDIPPDEMHVPNIPTYEDLYGGVSP